MQLFIVIEENKLLNRGFKNSKLAFLSYWKMEATYFSIELLAIDQIRYWLHDWYMI